METTERGFKIYGKVIDSNGCEIAVQESSIIGRPHAYVFTYDRKGVYRGGEPSPHLTVEQANELRNILTKFIEDAADPGNWRNDPAYKEECG